MIQHTVYKLVRRTLLISVTTHDNEFKMLFRFGKGFVALMCLEAVQISVYSDGVFVCGVLYQLTCTTLPLNHS